MLLSLGLERSDGLVVVLGIGGGCCAEGLELLLRSPQFSFQSEDT